MPYMCHQVKKVCSFVLMGTNCDSSGPLSSVWKEWVKWCIEFGIEANAIIAVPYDWRLSPSKLEERDLYFHKLKFVAFRFFSTIFI